MDRSSLKEFTKQDWDTLFPLELVDHDPEWKNIFKTEKEILLKAAGPFIECIEHFGSSSIPGIKSKPYIDILVELPQELDVYTSFVQALEETGYTCLTGIDPKAGIVLVKGYFPDGTTDQVFHLHACSKGNPMLQQLRFRDYLRANSARAKDYEALKLSLLTSFRNDRSGYRIAKTQFITRTLEMATAR